jgi:hypothetical protein
MYQVLLLVVVCSTEIRQRGGKPNRYRAYLTMTAGGAWRMETLPLRAPPFSQSPAEARVKLKVHCKPSQSQPLLSSFPSFHQPSNDIRWVLPVLVELRLSQQGPCRLGATLTRVFRYCMGGVLTHILVDAFKEFPQQFNVCVENSQSHPKSARSVAQELVRQVPMELHRVTEGHLATLYD